MGTCTFGHVNLGTGFSRKQEAAGVMGEGGAFDFVSFSVVSFFVLFKTIIPHG